MSEKTNKSIRQSYYEGRTIEFIGSLKQTGNAIKIDAEGTGEITFSVPASELPELIRMTLFAGKAVKINITEEGV